MKLHVTFTVCATGIQLAAQGAAGESRAAVGAQQRDKKAAEVREWQPDNAELVYLRALKNPVSRAF
jgi:hypothetical protein